MLVYLFYEALQSIRILVFVLLYLTPKKRDGSKIAILQQNKLRP